MADFLMSYREVIPDQTVSQTWKDIALNTGITHHIFRLSRSITTFLFAPPPPEFRSFAEHPARYKSGREGWWLLLQRCGQIS